MPPASALDIRAAEFRKFSPRLSAVHHHGTASSAPHAHVDTTPSNPRCRRSYSLMACRSRPGPNCARPVVPLRCIARIMSSAEEKTIASTQTSDRVTRSPAVEKTWRQVCSFRHRSGPSGTSARHSHKQGSQGNACTMRPPRRIPAFQLRSTCAGSSAHCSRPDDTCSVASGARSRNASNRVHTAPGTARRPTATILGDVSVACTFAATKPQIQIVSAPVPAPNSTTCSSTPASINAATRSANARWGTA